MILGLAKKVQAAVGGEKVPPITLEPNARVWEPEPVEDIILLGMGASCIQLISDVYECKFEEKGKREVWAINHSAFLLRHTVAHNMGDLTDPNRMAGPEHSFIDLYRDHPQPLVTTRYIKEIKNCYEFPWELIFNTWNDYYFQTGPALTLALAMISADRYERKTGRKPTIRLYGFEYNYPGRTNYEEGRCCLEYWVGRAKQAGFHILVPDTTSLLDQSSYSMGNAVGLHGNGFCYGLGKARPIFGVEEGKLWLKAFKYPEEAPQGEVDVSGENAFPVEKVDDGTK